MNNVRENKKINLLPVILALFLFFRGVLLTDRKYLGIEDFFELQTDFSAEKIAFIVLLFLYAVFASLVIDKISKCFGESAKYISVLLVSEPLFFAKQDNCVVLFITVLALAFVLNALREKPVVPNEITLIVFLLISTVLSENAIFLFVLPAFIAYFVGDAEKILKSTKKLVMLILSLISVGAGIFLNDYLLENVPAFDSFIKTYSFFENIYFKHVEYENVLLFIFAVPTLILGVYFLAEFVQKSKETGKAVAYIAVSFIAVAYALSVTGFFLRGSEALFTVNYIVPVAVCALIKNKNSAAISALEKINGIASEHTLVFVSVVIFLCFVASRIFYGDVDNIAGFILAI